MIKSNSPVFWRTKYTEFSNKSPKAANRTCCREIILNLLNHPGIIKSHFQEVILEIHYPFSPDFLFVCIFYLMLSVSKLFPKKRLSLSQTDGDVQARSCQTIPSSNGAPANTHNPFCYHPRHTPICPQKVMFHLTCTHYSDCRAN